DDEADCDIGDVLVIDVAAMADGDAALLGVGEVNPVNADAETDDAAKLWQRIDHLVGNADMPDGDGGADVFAIRRPVHDLVVGQPHFEEAERRGNERRGFGHERTYGPMASRRPAPKHAGEEPAVRVRPRFWPSSPSASRSARTVSGCPADLGSRPGGTAPRTLACLRVRCRNWSRRTARRGFLSRPSAVSMYRWRSHGSSTRSRPCRCLCLSP